MLYNQSCIIFCLKLLYKHVVCIIVRIQSDSQTKSICSGRSSGLILFYKPFVTATFQKSGDTLAGRTGIIAEQVPWNKFYEVIIF